MLCVAASGLDAQDSPQPSGTAVTCEVRTIAGARFTSCHIPRGALGALEIAPAPDPSSRSWTIARLDSALRSSGRQLLMATNAGIFGPDGRPLGLLIANRHTVAALETSAGPPPPPGGSVCDIANFYCPPGGVFFLRGDRAAVERTDVFRRDSVGQPAPRLATQSGPMLVERGALAREFPASWRRRLPRNAACVRDDGSVVLALGEDQTQGSFAAALRDSFSCRDALFLDGSISKLYTGGCLPADDADYAAIIYVAAPVTRPAPPPCSSESGLVRDDPYSAITVRLGATRAQPLGQGRRFFPGDLGGAFQVEMPFRFGRLGLTADQVTLRSSHPDSADVRTRGLAADWRVDVPLGRQVVLHPGARLGVMASHSEGSSASAASRDTRQFVAGLTMSLELKLARQFSLVGEAAWLHVPSASRAHLGHLAAYVSYDLSTPRVMRRVLRRAFGG